MEGLPKIPGLEILALLGRDELASRYRLRGPESLRLVLFHDSGPQSAVQDGARRYSSVDLEGLIPIERVIRHEDRLGVVLRGDLGSDLWRSPILGELEALPLLHQLADLLAGLFCRGLVHGALKPGGACRLPDGTVVVLPPVILPGFLPDVAEAPEGASLSPAGRDLSALGDLACHLIAGLKPSRIAGVGSLPEALKNVASPATAQAVRILLESAARDPSPDEAAEVLKRLGWACPDQATARRRRPVREDLREPAPWAGNPELGQRGRPAARIPVLAGVLVLGLLGAVLLMIGAGDALSEFWSGRPRPPATLPTPRAPLDHRVPEIEELVEVAGQVDRAEASQSALPGFGDASSSQDTEAVSTALADEILAKLAEKRDRKAPLRRKRRGGGQPLIREGDRLKEQGLKVLADLRVTKVAPRQKNAWLEQAISLLEQSREKYEAFAEQFPARERLVERSLTEVNASISLAHKQKIRK